MYIKRSIITKKLNHLRYYIFTIELSSAPIYAIPAQTIK